PSCGCPSNSASVDMYTILDPSWLQLGAAAPLESPLRMISPDPLPVEASRSIHKSFADVLRPYGAISTWSPSRQWPFENVSIPSGVWPRADRPAEPRNGGGWPTVAASSEASELPHG